MLEIRSVNHVGIRVSKKQVFIEFYAALGFELLGYAGDSGSGYAKHP